MQAPQAAWDEREEQAKTIWQRSFKRVLEAMYRRVKEEVYQCAARLLGLYEWGVAIMYSEAITATRRTRVREEDTTVSSNTVKQ